MTSFTLIIRGFVYFLVLSLASLATTNAQSSTPMRTYMEALTPFTLGTDAASAKPTPLPASSPGSNAPQSSSKRTCAVVHRYLALGSRGADVVALQTFLVQNGWMPDVVPTGYFGRQTASALARWQASRGFEPIGATGPLTRAALSKCDTEASTQKENQVPQQPTAAVAGVETPIADLKVNSADDKVLIDHSSTALELTWNIDPRFTYCVLVGADTTPTELPISGRGRIFARAKFTSGSTAAIVAHCKRRSVEAGQVIERASIDTVRVVNQCASSISCSSLPQDGGGSSPSLTATPSQTTESVELLLNGSRGPLALTEQTRQTVVASWRTSGAQLCTLANGVLTATRIDDVASGSLVVTVPPVAEWAVVLACSMRSGRELLSKVTTTQPAGGGLVQVISPNGGERLDPAQESSIRVVIFGVSSYSIGVAKDGQLIGWIEQDTPARASDRATAVERRRSWSVPALLSLLGSTTSPYQIMVRGVSANGDGIVEDLSDQTFEIIGRSAPVVMTRSAVGQPASASGPSVTVDALEEHVVAGGHVTVEWSRAAASGQRDWIALVPAGTQWTAGLPWAYVEAGQLQGRQKIRVAPTLSGSGAFDVVY
jgi:Putative peptidoglycan binding domain